MTIVSPDKLPSARAVELTAPLDDIYQILNEDGAVIIKNFIPLELVDKINKEVDPYLAQHAAGPNHMSEIYKLTVGSKTKHMGNLTMASKSFRDEVLNHPSMHAISEKLFRANFGDYWLNRAAVLEVDSGEKAQGLHRDDSLYPWKAFLTKDSPELMVNFFIALTEFREENGATRLVLGSHKWEDSTRYPSPEQTIPAEMQAGDAIVYLASLFHGAGQNRSQKTRRGLSITTHPAHFTPMESHIDVPRAIIENMTPLAQKMIGWRTWSTNHGVPVWTVRDGRMEDELKLKSLESPKQIQAAVI
uniref:Dioxygenase olcK n=1 Tax=Penicillium canescens TaxID=5083 RepID=OLCK_PENCN|nr:RecName: Full=Dioxygenase olcK; AltName: Full=15-deoxyoxalicine B biosynthesis cluster protein K [Penicillium canescens]